MNGERRTNPRLLLHSWVEITGVDESGLQFSERSRLEDVGDSGCRFSLRGKVQQGSVLGLKPLGPEGENLADEFPRMFLVIWAKREGDRFKVGVRGLREDELACSRILEDISSLNSADK